MHHLLKNPVKTQMMTLIKTTTMTREEYMILMIHHDLYKVANIKEKKECFKYHITRDKQKTCLKKKEA
jgi:ABC-type Mn2+/Zn2+ transport system ATPase subunit